MWTVLDLVEAAMRTAHTDEAAAHAAAAVDAGLPAISSRLALITCGAAAVAAVDDDTAFSAFDQALGVPDVDQWPFDLARVQLLFGERLRRARATGRARQLLADAHDTFQRLGAAPWTQRAGNELRATGHPIGPARRRTSRRRSPHNSSRSPSSPPKD